MPCCPAEVTALDLSKLRDLMVQRAKDIHEGKIKPGEGLSEEAIVETYRHISTVIGNENTAQLPSRSVTLMQQNIYRFSGAKDYAMLELLNSKLYKDGKKMSYKEFEKEALKINSEYNRNYLQAEFQTAQQAGEMAALWESYQRNKSRFPNLKYKTQEDDRVREEHKALEGLVVPIDHDFWNMYYPPNGWRCRCYTVQTAEEPSSNIPQKVASVKPEFEINVGKKHEIFKETGTSPHPYFQLSQKSAKGNRQIKEAFELTKLHAPFNKVKTKKGKTLEVSIFADTQDLESNLKTAKLLADFLTNSSIKINPHLEGYKNPELEIDGRKGDKVVPTSQNIRSGIKNAFDDKLKKNGQLRGLQDTFIVLDLNNYPQSKLAGSVSDIAREINSKIKRYSKIKDCFLEYNGKMVQIKKIQSYDEILEQIALLP